MARARHLLAQRELAWDRCLSTGGVETACLGVPRPEMEHLRRLVAAGREVREERVAELRAQVQSGAYVVLIDLLARRLLDILSDWPAAECRARGPRRPR